MHGDENTKEIPIYGRKVIAMREGILDLHGKPKTPTWLKISQVNYINFSLKTNNQTFRPQK